MTRRDERREEHLGGRSARTRAELRTRTFRAAHEVDAIMRARRVTEADSEAAGESTLPETLS
jgi:hypothetical protein